MNTIHRALIALASFAAPALAQNHFTLLPYNWQGTKPVIPFYVSTNLAGRMPNAGPESFEDAVAAIVAGAEAWNRIPGANARLEYVGLTSVASAADDGLNVVMWSAGVSPVGGVAITRSWVSGSTYRGFDIEFFEKLNATSSINWTIHTQTESGSGFLGRDIWTFAAHEFGHALGLGHTSQPDSGALMNAGTTGQLVRTPGAVDINAIAARFPTPTGPALSAGNLTPAPGEWVDLELYFPARAGKPYRLYAGASGDAPGVNVSQLVTNSANQSEQLLVAQPHLSTADPLHFENFEGALDGAGRATARLRIPSNANASYSVAALVYEPAAQPNSTRFLECSAVVRLDTGLPVVRVPFDFASIQAAVNSIPAGRFGATVLVGPGEYYENLELGGKRVHVRSEAGPLATTIDGSFSGSVVRYSAPVSGDCSLEGFTLRNGLADFGAGVLCSRLATPRLEQLHLVANVAGSGGGALACRGLSRPTLVECWLAGNSAPRGAGVLVQGISSAWIGSCDIASNSASQDGGGVLARDPIGPSLWAPPVIVNCRVRNNSAAGAGGGLRLETNATVKVANCTIVANTAGGVGGGIAAGRAGQFGWTSVEVVNSILWNNAPTQVAQVDGLAALAHCDVELGWPGAGNLDLDPQFVDPATNNWRLACSSPLLDSGSSALLPADEADLDGDGDRGEPLPLDFAGAPRAGGAEVDMGAHEFESSYSYCEPGVSAAQCRATIAGSGVASASAASGFVVTVSGVDGQRLGLLFYGVSGSAWSAWGANSTLCVKAPTQRTNVQNSGGLSGQCNGSFQLDWNAWRAAHPGALGQPFAWGDHVWLQAWYRDPATPKTTALSDALAAPICP